MDWTVSALIEAEALGITKQSVVQATKRGDMRAEQLPSHDFATGQALGLSHDWAAKVIAATGNYGEIFQRATGEPYHLDRGTKRAVDRGKIDEPIADEVTGQRQRVTLDRADATNGSRGPVRDVIVWWGALGGILRSHSGAE